MSDYVFDLGDLADLLSPYELNFFQSEFAWSSRFDVNNEQSMYEKRLMNLGFVGMDHVLDAGCGMGQWSLALGSLNQWVTGIDVNSARLMVGDTLHRKLGKHNVNFKYGSCENIPLDDNSVDAVFC